MEQGNIFNWTIGLFIFSGGAISPSSENAVVIFFVICIIYLLIRKKWQLLMKIWNSFPSPARFIIIIISCIVLAAWLTISYNSFYDNILNFAVERHVYDEALSNIYRNKILLAFAIFGICLAIWSRVVSQQQLEKTIEMNRNDRFAKAAEMLSNIKNKISSRGGLYMLRDLIVEDPKTEYIRCVEVISYWILEDKNRRADIADADRYLSIVVAQILKIRSDNEMLENTIEKYKDDNNIGKWPFLKSAKLRSTILNDANLQGASLTEVDLRDARLIDVNLQGARLRKAKLQKAILQNADLRGAYLRDAKLKGAYLRGVKLDGADITSIDMRNTEGLTKDNIRSTKWFINFVDDGNKYSNGVPPKLPDYLMKDDEMKEWLKKDSNGIVFKPNKSKAKKAKAKKPKN